MTILSENAKYRFQSELSSRPGRSAVDLRFTSSTSQFPLEARLPLCHPDRSVAQWRDLQCAPRPSRILLGKTPTPKQNCRLDRGERLLRPPRVPAPYNLLFSGFLHGGLRHLRTRHLALLATTLIAVTAFAQAPENPPLWAYPSHFTAAPSSPAVKTEVEHLPR